MNISIPFFVGALSVNLLCCKVEARASFTLSNPIKHTIAMVDTALPAAATKSPRGKTSYTGFAGTKAGSDRNSYNLFYEKAEILKHYTGAVGYNSEYAILIDISIDESRKRLFAVDLSSNTIVKYGTVGIPKIQIRGLLGLYKTSQHLNTTAFILQPIHVTANQPMQSTILLKSSESASNDNINDKLLPTASVLNICPALLAEINQLLQKGSKPVVIWIYRGDE